MPNSSSGRSVLVLVAAVLAVCGALLTTQAPAAAGATTGADRLTLTWVEDGRQLRVEGSAYQPKAVVDVRFGSDPARQARSDAHGRIQVTVPREHTTAGQSGASIVVAGRSVSGASRVLISAVPPRAAVRGPADVLPLSIAALMLAGVALGALHRVRSRRDTAAPRGYRRRHAA